MSQMQSQLCQRFPQVLKSISALLRPFVSGGSHRHREELGSFLSAPSLLVPLDPSHIDEDFGKSFLVLFAF